MSAFKRIQNGQPSATYWLKFPYNGKQQLFKTTFTKKADAERHQAELIRAFETVSPTNPKNS